MCIRPKSITSRQTNHLTSCVKVTYRDSLLSTLFVLSNSTNNRSSYCTNKKWDPLGICFACVQDKLCISTTAVLPFEEPPISTTLFLFETVPRTMTSINVPRGGSSIYYVLSRSMLPRYSTRPSGICRPASRIARLLSLTI